MPFELKKNPEKVLICGMGPGWEQAPDNTEYEVWGLNHMAFAQKNGKRLNRLFMMDVVSEMPSVLSGQLKVADIIRQVNELNVPFVSAYQYAEIPMSEAFPLEKARKELGLPYFSNTIAYMIAYAIMKGVKEIQIFGVNQASNSEYFTEKAGVEYMIGIANGRGIKVVINGGKSELLSNKARYGGELLYGYNKTYEQVLRDAEQFGWTRKLLAPVQNSNREIRAVN